MAAVSVKRYIVKAAFELKSSRGCEKRSKASPDRRIVKRLLIKRFDDLFPPLRQKKETRSRMRLVYARALQCTYNQGDETNFEGFVWSHQSITELISQISLGSCSFRIS